MGARGSDPHDDEIAAVRALIRRDEQIIDELDIDEIGVSLRYATASPRKVAPASANGAR